jgi:hypothetical protein
MVQYIAIAYAPTRPGKYMYLECISGNTVQACEDKSHAKVYTNAKELKRDRLICIKQGIIATPVSE